MTQRRKRRKQNKTSEITLTMFKRPSEGSALLLFTLYYNNFTHIRQCNHPLVSLSSKLIRINGKEIKSRSFPRFVSLFLKLHLHLRSTLPLLSGSVLGHWLASHSTSAHTNASIDCFRGREYTFGSSARLL